MKSSNICKRVLAMALAFTLFAVAAPISVFSTELPTLPQPGDLLRDSEVLATEGWSDLTVVEQDGVARIAITRPEYLLDFDRFEVIISGDVLEFFGNPVIAYDTGNHTVAFVHEIFTDGERITLFIDHSLGTIAEMFVPFRIVAGTQDASIYSLPARAGTARMGAPAGVADFPVYANANSPNQLSRIVNTAGSVRDVFIPNPSSRLPYSTHPTTHPAITEMLPIVNHLEQPLAVTPTPILNPPVINSQTTVILTVGNTLFTIDGVQHQAEAPPFVAAGSRTMVPLRFIAEALGVEVGWISETRTATVSGNGISLSLPLDVPLPNDMGTPVLVGSRTFVPLRFIAEALGANIEWCGDTQRIAITGGYV